MIGRAVAAVSLVSLSLAACDSKQANDLPTNHNTRLGSDGVLNVRPGTIVAAFMRDPQQAARDFSGHRLSITGRVDQMQLHGSTANLVLSRPPESGQVTAVVPLEAALPREGDIVALGCSSVDGSRRPVVLRDCSGASVLDQDR